jgi:hypothetical protein
MKKGGREGKGKVKGSGLAAIFSNWQPAGVGDTPGQDSQVHFQAGNGQHFQEL